MKVHLSLFILLIVSALAWNVRKEIQNDPKPNPPATVVVGNARFTVLTQQLLRLEYNPIGPVFVDDASLVVINRNLPVPAFSVKTAGNTTIIDTTLLQVFYDPTVDSGDFTQGSLKISFTLNGGVVNWYPGLANEGNLQGARASLDCYEWNCTHGMPLSDGLLSLDGWYVMDDSVTPLFNYNVSDGIPWIVEPSLVRAQNSLDWYFFGYGMDFRGTLFDFTQIAGPISMPPVSAFGSWWSRFYNYSQETITDQIIDGYKNHSLPLNHLVLDMDWHIEINDPQCTTWGGYAWNTALFPDPPQFIDWLHGPENNLKLLLNIHPQSGLDVCQPTYYEVAKAIGFDTSKNASIPCDFYPHDVATALFDLVLANIGADYWWTDFGGCNTGENIPTQFDLLWSNYLFDQHKTRDGTRPLVLSRWGGLGSHRYPIGFSGDAYSVFTELQFEVYFTMTGANVLFGYWSNDLGGFHGDYHTGNPNCDDELFLRWLQFGAVSPIFRIHSDHQERRIWMFPSYEAMKDVMLFRNAISPYVYTQSRRSYDTGVAIVHPLYYHHPQSPEAYNYTEQYMFGEDFFVAPIVTAGDNTTNTTSKSIWLPPGSWYDWNAMSLIQGPQAFTRSYPFAQSPIFVRAGAVVPMKDMISVTNYRPDPLIFALFPGADYGSGKYYEDDGNTTQYQEGAFAFTLVNYKWSTKNLAVQIGAPDSTFDGQPQTRTFQVNVVTGTAPSTVQFTSPSGTIDITQVPVGSTGAGWWIGAMGLVVQTPANTTSVDDISFSITF